MMVLGFLLFLFAFMFTWGIKNYAIANNVIDIPNNRSSHVNPTPRGGGIAIVCAFLLALLLIYFSIDTLPQIGLLGILATFIVAVVGFFDDHRHIDAKWRLLFHFIAAILILWDVGGFPQIMIFNVEFELGVFGDVFALFSLVWILNLFNFMDGIDGLAGSEAITVSIIVGILLMNIGADNDIINLLLFFSVSVLGFLLWNFPKAKIFMGDAGSGFMGITIGMFILLSTRYEAKFLWIWLIVLGVFIVDSAYTLCQRYLNCEIIYEAHCSHAYQKASKKYNSHVKVTLFVIAINFFWLAPLAYIVSIEKVDGFLGVVIAYIPLIFIDIYFGAGNDDKLSPQSL